jgi:hypothetical protein
VNSYLAARRVILGQDPPGFLAGKDQTLEQWLAFIAHGFPGEQVRAEKALSLIASEALDFAYRTEWENFTRVGGSPEVRANTMAAWRNRLRRYRWNAEDSDGIMPYGFVMEARTPHVDGTWPGLRQLNLNIHAQTSHFAVQELGFVTLLTRYAAFAVSEVARRHAERTGLALIAYRLEHDEYPDSLDSLQPIYLTTDELQDPYAAKPLQYRRDGFVFPCGFGLVGHRSKLIAPHTPLIWSVGEGRVEPIEEAVRMEKTPGGDYFLGDGDTLRASAPYAVWDVWERAIFFVGAEAPSTAGAVLVTLPVD